MSDTISGQVQGFDALVQQQAAAMQVEANQQPSKPALSFTPGAILLAIAQAVAGIALWLQASILNLLLVARAATSNGPDLDSWMAQFQVTRIPATAANCSTVQLSRYSYTDAVTIIPGGLVMTTDGSQQFTIIADPTQAAWSAIAGGYVMGAGVSSCLVTAAASTLGLAANVAAGTITQFASGVLGADTVTNTGPATGGANAESDPALRARFWNYLQYLWRATAQAVTYAIQSIQAGLSVTIVDGYNEAGQFSPGCFVATVDDGSGNPPASLIARALVAVNATRALGIRGAVHGPTTLVVNVAGTIITASPTQDATAAQNAVAAYFAGVSLGGGISYFRLGAVMENASSTIVETNALTLNGASGDVAGLPTQKILLGTVTISTAAP
jgi:hypothetical protein